MSKYTAREYDEADATYTAMEEAETALKELIEALKNTRLEDYAALDELLEEVKNDKAAAEEVLGQEQAETDELNGWEWTHR